jgi:LacI family transcriptional regulator
MGAGDRTRVTIADVARAAGVGTATAGRALGGYGYASEPVRRRVQDAAERLGYSPNQVARSLITGRSQTIGVVAGDIQSPFYASVLRGIEDVAREAGFGVLLTNSDEQPAREVAAVRLLAEKQVDGMIVAPGDIVGAAHLRAVAASLPLVQIDRVVQGLAADSVTVDNLAAARACTAALVAAGHRRIAIVAELERWEGGDLPAFLAAAACGLDPATLFPSWQRLLGWLLAHRDAGLPVDPALIARVGAYSAPEAQRATAAALDAAPRPTAVFSTDGLMSGAVMAVLNARGVAVPEGLSLVCFDDLDWMRFHRPPITAVVQPMAEIGRQAAGLLLARIAAAAGAGAPAPPRHAVLQADLILRGSIAPPPG